MRNTSSCYLINEGWDSGVIIPPLSDADIAIDYGLSRPRNIDVCPSCCVMLYLCYHIVVCMLNKTDLGLCLQVKKFYAT